MPPSGPVVVKLGGSLIAGPADLDPLLDAVLAAPRPTVVVAGGGPFADAVRAAQAAIGFSEALAHRLALDAMGHFAEVIAERRPAFVRVSGRPSVAAAHAAGRQALWDPSALRAGHPDLPESWDVTSDSLALFLGREIGAAATILVKSAEPAAAGTPALRRLVAGGYVDRAFPAFLDRHSGIVRLLGPADHHRLGEAIADPGAAIGLAVARGGTAPARAGE